MRRVFKAFFLKQLRMALESGTLVLHDSFPNNRKDYYLWKESLYQKQWVVYTKKPFQGVQNVVKYLSRYSHRVAITNHRLRQIDEHQVHFQYKDYADDAKKKVMILDGPTFLKRFCLHILPPRFRKVRQLGFLANVCKAKDLDRARKALGLKQKQLLNRAQRKDLAKHRLFKEQVDCCPCCKKGKMVIIDVWLANKDPPLYLTGIPLS